jgi:hypothetical protein
MHYSKFHNRQHQQNKKFFRSEIRTYRATWKRFSVKAYKYRRKGSNALNVRACQKKKCSHIKYQKYIDRSFENPQTSGNYWCDLDESYILRQLGYCPLAGKPNQKKAHEEAMEKVSEYKKTMAHIKSSLDLQNPKSRKK